jgi:hypothetical protein
MNGNTEEKAESIKNKAERERQISRLRLEVSGVGGSAGLAEDKMRVRFIVDLCPVIIMKMPKREAG